MGAVSFWVVVGGGSARANEGLSAVGLRDRGSRLWVEASRKTLGAGFCSFAVVHRPSPVQGREKLAASKFQEREHEKGRERGERER